MSIEKIVKPYEVLIRFKNGVYSGSHIKDIETVYDTESGEVYSDKELDARAIYKDSQEYQDVISGINADTLSQLDLVMVERDDLKTQKQELEADIESKDSEILTKDLEIQELKIRIEELESTTEHEEVVE